MGFIVGLNHWIYQNSKQLMTTLMEYHCSSRKWICGLVSIVSKNAKSNKFILRENNFSIISNDTDYFICDIEYAKNESVEKDEHVTKEGSRFDMVGVKWLSKSLDRKNKDSISLAIFELKYGDGAMTGSAGILKHFKDLDDFMSKGKHVELMDEAESQFNQKYYLGLIEVTKSKKENDFDGVFEKIKINRNIKPEYILDFCES
jgi:hypothetical protein